MRPALGPGDLQRHLVFCLFEPEDQSASQPHQLQQHELRTKVLALMLTFVGVLRHASHADGHWIVGGGGGREAHKPALSSEAAARSSTDGDARVTLVALSAILWQVLPVLEVLLKGVASIWEPAVCQAMAPSLKLVMVPAELLILADPGHRSSDTDCGHVLATQVGAWLRQVREACFELVLELAHIGNVIGFFEYLLAHPSLVAALLGHWHSLENRHIRSVLRNALVPILRHCPARMLPALLQPVLPPLLTNCLERLQSAYAALADGRMVEGDCPERGTVEALQRFLGDNTLAVVREGTMRLLHRDVCDAALALCNIQTQSTMLEGGGLACGGDGAGDDEARGSSAMQADGGAPGGQGGGCEGGAASALEAVLGMGKSMTTLLQILGHSLEFPDDVACSKSVEAAQRLLPRLQGEMQGVFDAAYARDMLRHALRALRRYIRGVEGAEGAYSRVQGPGGAYSRVQGPGGADVHGGDRQSRDGEGVSRGAAGSLKE
jgi:hypothetical protein